MATTATTPETGGNANGTFGRLAEWLSRDYCPGADRYLIDWCRHPLGTLAILSAVSALCGTYLHHHGFLFAAGLMGLAALGSAWPWLAIRGTRATVEFDRARTEEGDEAIITLRVRNRSPLSIQGLTLRVRESGRNGASAGRLDTVLAALPAIRGFATREFSIAWTPDRRGEFPGSGRELRVATGFPFGLHAFSRAVACDAPILARPRAHDPGMRAESGDAEDVRSLAPTNRVGTTGDILGVRPYRRGDSLRRVHWGQTARRGELIVCEAQAQTVPRLLLVVDVDKRSVSGDAWDADNSLEWSLRWAAGVVRRAIGEGAVVEVRLGRTRLPARGGPRHREAILDAMARIPAGGEDGGTEVAEGVAGGRDPNVAVVWIGTEAGRERVGDRLPRWTRTLTLREEDADVDNDHDRPRFAPIERWGTTARGIVEREGEGDASGAWSAAG